MRVLFVSQYFSPEVTAASLRLSALARGLAERGHEVEVLCEVPNHPSGVIEPGYRGRAVVRRPLDGYRVDHVWVWARPSKRARSRIASYGSFAAMAMLVGSARRRPDAIVASSPPLSVGLAGMLLAKRFRVPWVLDVRDLWPEVAVALGELAPGPLLSASERLERRLYRSAAGITVTTEPFRSHIERLGTEAPIELLPNGTTRDWLEIGRSAPDRAAAGLPDEETFAWTYAGNLGIAQGLAAAVDAARELGDGFQLTMLGDGPERDSLIARAGDQFGRGIVFRDPVEPDRAALIMRASDALLVSLADRPALEKCVPGKLYQCGAMRRPMVVSAAGETRALTEREQAGITVRPGDSEGLAAAVRTLRSEPDTAARLVAGGERLAAGSLREDGVAKLERLLGELAVR